MLIKVIKKMKAKIIEKDSKTIFSNLLSFLNHCFILLINLVLN